jgi:hypothetical protein
MCANGSNVCLILPLSIDYRSLLVDRYCSTYDGIISEVLLLLSVTSSFAPVHTYNTVYQRLCSHLKHDNFNVIDSLLQLQDLSDLLQGLHVVVYITLIQKMKHQ